MSIITIISHPKPPTGNATTALTEQRRDFDTVEDAIAYLHTMQGDPVKGNES